MVYTKDLKSFADRLACSSHAAGTIMNTEYISIEKQMYLDAQKYLIRAQDYMIEGKYGHASGCLAKAARKITNAQHLFSITSDEGLDKLLKRMIDMLSRKITSSILKL